MAKKPHVTAKRAANNRTARKEAPRAAPSGSEYSEKGMGGGKLVDRGKKR